MFREQRIEDKDKDLTTCGGLDQLYSNRRITRHELLELVRQYCLIHIVLKTLPAGMFREVVGDLAAGWRRQLKTLFVHAAEYKEPA